MKRLLGEQQEFTKRDRDGGLVVIEVKNTDDFLAACTRDEVIEFSELIDKRLPVGKEIVGDRTNYKGLVI